MSAPGKSPAKMVPKNAKQAPKKKSRRPKNFAAFWDRLMKRKEKKDAASPSAGDKIVKRAVDKMTKRMGLGKQEQQQVSRVLAEEVERRMREGQAEIDADVGYEEAVKEAAKGESVFPILLSTDMLASNVQAVPIAVDANKFGAQPSMITLDDAALNEIKAHTFINVFQQMLLDAAQSDDETPPSSSYTKDPTELVDLRKRDAAAWDEVSKMNSLVSFALTKPTAADQSKKSKGRPLSKIEFDPRVEVVEEPKCASCQHVLIGKTVDAMGKVWHNTCFVCTACRASLATGFQVDESKGPDSPESKPHCPTCYAKLFPPMCRACGRGIDTETYVSVLNATWHQNCLVCTTCNVVLGTEIIWPVDNMPYCEQHYHAARLHTQQQQQGKTQQGKDKPNPPPAGK